MAPDAIAPERRADGLKVAKKRESPLEMWV
jgi:hypothetical protein